MGYLSQRNPEQVIGDISIVKIDEDDSSCEIGYVLGKVYWGHGMMTEGLESCLGLLFYSSRFSKCQSKICKSQSSFRSCHGEGWNVLSKTITNGVERKGYLADLIYYQISREESEFSFLLSSKSYCVWLFFARFLNNLIKFLFFPIIVPVFSGVLGL